MSESIQIEVLGEFRVVAPEGTPIVLPASRKTKALLAYLALTGRQHSRQHLCDLLWDGADDPRGALRWSLSRLRAGLDSSTRRCIDSDRRVVGLAPQAVSVDLHEAKRAMASDGGTPPLDTLRGVAEIFGGELLEELDLLDSFRFHSWCVGQREEARALRLKVLTTLIDQVPEIEEALKYAHVLVSADPLNEDAHTRVVRLLMQMRRHEDAQDQVDSYRRTLEIELGEVPRDVAARLRKVVNSDAEVPRRVTAKRAPAPTPAPSPEALPHLPMVGRAGELASLEAWLAPAEGAVPMAVISGEPGAGKTRLMDELTRRLAEDTLVIHGRAYRAESSRAFGPWRDAFADIDGTASVLDPTVDAAAEQQRRAQLFDELLTLIGARASVTRRLVIALDDIQWLDEASAAFMHFLVRARPGNVALVCTVRAEELIDNPAVGSMLEALRTDRSTLELELTPLAQQEIGEICSAVDDRIDAAEVYDRCEGNPFVATEIARALARGETDLPSSTRNLVKARFRTLSEPARDLLPWAAALGRTFHIDVLERVTGLDPVVLLDCVGELEERSILEPRSSGAYDFVHELIRDAAYRRLSAPRQRIVHRSIARSLDSWGTASADFSAIELMRHAELGGEGAIACRAGVVAAQDAFAVCAWLDACVAADRALQHTAALGADAPATALELLSCRVSAGSLAERQHPDHVTAALAGVIEMGSAQQKAGALTLQSIVQHDRDDFARAEDFVVAAVDAVREAEPEPAARQLASAARCLIQIERDVDQARTMLHEARETLTSIGAEDLELSWGEALLARWDGDADGSAERLLHAITLGKQSDKRWQQSSCLTHLIMVASEAGDADRVEQLAGGALVYGNDDGEPLKSPYVEALAGLADFRRDPSSTARVDKANDVLRRRGAKSQLAYVLAELARTHAELGDFERARSAAEETVGLGDGVQRVVPQTDALVTIAWICLKTGDIQGGLDAVARAETLSKAPDSVATRVRSRMCEVAAALRASAG